MRMKKALFTLGTFGIVMFFFATASVVYAAPDMSVWVEKWFSYQTTTKGFAFTGSGFVKGSEKEKGYLNIRTWDPVEETFQVDVYFLDDRGWQTSTETLYYYKGSNLNFVFGVHSTTDLVGIVSGKEKNGDLKSATITSLGGYVLESDEDGFSVGSITLKGKMVDESKVKVPADVIIP